MQIEMTLPLPTSINKLYINQFGWNPKTKTRMPTGKRIMSKDGVKVKNEIQNEAIKQLTNQEWDYEWTKENYIYQDCYIYMNRLGRDDNNLFKLLNDSLEKIVYDNDSRVLTRTQRILIDSENPRIILHISQTPHRGIFDDENKIYIFEENCKTCKRYLRNCSILKKAKEGRVQSEINEVDGEFVCSKYSEIKVKSNRTKSNSHNPLLKDGE
ncbi:RusA family crossover junction endodeoxyribonuclease [Metabacillus arenae]|uniref:RusA family crossover junction endodeoxyribonuclease n=1 Tax=Metabacillus arenae TaxID=2771434 RepID=A0A926NDX1_9BACI|nr:RusA family crossover junction endodeoxyribonuclease [Metabacillus arenae]MBD1379050.1 RusA family crossover junction endodeoxyribonuclease [Metabacillus arenae]